MPRTQKEDKGGRRRRQNALGREQRGSEDPRGWGQRGIEPPGRGMGWKKRDVVGEMGSELALRGKERSVHAGGHIWVHMGRMWGILNTHGWVIKHLFSLLSSQRLISLKACRHGHDEVP